MEIKLKARIHAQRYAVHKTDIEFQTDLSSCTCKDLRLQKASIDTEGTEISNKTEN